MSVLNKLSTLKIRVYPLYIETLLLGGFVRLLVLMVPGKNLFRSLKKIQSTVYTEPLPHQQSTIEEICLAVSRVAKYVPWRFQCLEQGLTAKLLLRQHGIESTLVFGVVYGEKKEMLSHAWLRCGHVVVIGNRGMNHFNSIAVLN